jgi:hypothetical protein
MFRWRTFYRQKATKHNRIYILVMGYFTTYFRGIAMKTIIMNEKLFLIIMLCFLTIISPENAFSQRERITSDSSQSIRSTNDSISSRQSKKKSPSASEQFKKFKGILPSNNSFGLMSMGLSESFGTVLCRLYKDKFESRFSDTVFADNHIKISADDFALAFLLVENNEVKKEFGDGLDLAIARATVNSDGSVRTFEQILRKLFPDKVVVKTVVEDARKRLKEYVA